MVAAARLTFASSPGGQVALVGVQDGADEYERELLDAFDNGRFGRNGRYVGARSESEVLENARFAGMGGARLERATSCL